MKKQNQAFTMLELIIVVIILGILASIGVPKLYNNVTYSRALEGVHFLSAIRGAQMRYDLEYGGYTSDCDDLDIDLTSSPKNFDSIDCYANTDNIASIDEIDGQYVLYIDPDGDICCEKDTPGICQVIDIDECN